MPLLSRAESQFLRRHLAAARQVTLRRADGCVVRLHLLPPRRPQPDLPFLLLRNGRDLLPLRLSWAILLACWMEAVEPFAGRAMTKEEAAAARADAIGAAAAVYHRTPPAQIATDFDALLATLLDVAGKTPLRLPEVELGAYARYMTAPLRMDLHISAMVKDGAWHCNQKCLHCYAARQLYAEAEELDTDQWLAILEKCRTAGVPQLTFTGGEPTLRHDLVKLVAAAQWFVTRLNTNGRMLTPGLCRDLCEAGLDAVQITLYAAEEEVHNELAGAPGFADTVAGIRNAVAAGLNVSVYTPLCSLNRSYAATVRLAASLGVRQAACGGLSPTGRAETAESAATRLPPDALAAALREGRAAAEAEGVALDFTSPGWLNDNALQALGFARPPRCGAGLANLAIAPDGKVLPCQSWLRGPAIGDILHQPWPRIWNGTAARHIRRQAAAMRPGCLLER